MERGFAAGLLTGASDFAALFLADATGFATVFLAADFLLAEVLATGAVALRATNLLPRAFLAGDALFAWALPALAAGLAVVFLAFGLFMAHSRFVVGVSFISH